jgi:multiple sugar transport system substrate-binding protein
MKRLPPLLICAALLLPLLALGGCHGAEGMPAFSVPEEFDASRDYEITFWAKNDTNVTQLNIYKKAIADFEALYPNIRVVLRSFTDYAKIYNDVITNIPTRTTPNVCITYPDHIATYMTGYNTVVPLDGLIDDPVYGLGGSGLRFDSVRRDEIVPKFLGECYLGGTCYALPFMRSTEACYINRTLVEKLGYTVPDVLTWDFVWEVSEKALEKAADGTYKLNGQKTLIPFIYKSTDNMMIQMLRQKGADYSDSDGRILIFNDTVRELLKDLAPHVSSGAFSTFRIVSYPGNFINAGQCIFAIDSTAGATWIGSRAPMQDIDKKTIVDYELELRPIPQFDTSDPRMISQGPSLCVFNKEDPQEVLASWLFAQYLLSNEVQTAYARTEGYVPVTLKAQNSDAYLDYLSRAGEDDNDHYAPKIEAAKLLIANVDNTFVTPVFNGSAALREAAGELIEGTAKQVRRGLAVDDEFIDNLFHDTKLLKRLRTNGTGGSGMEDLGELPSTSKALLAAVGAAWAGLAVYGAVRLVKKKKAKSH